MAPRPDRSRHDPAGPEFRSRRHLTQMRHLLLIHAPAVKLTVNGLNLGAVRTLFPKISQLTLAAIVERDCPDYEVRVVDMKSANWHDTSYKEIPYGNRLIQAHRI